MTDSSENLPPNPEVGKPAAVADIDQFDRNYETFKDSPLGVIVREAYEYAVAVDPRLSEIGVVPISDPEEKRIAFATPAWATESGKHEINVRLDADLDATLAKYSEIMTQAPEAIKIICDRLGIEPSKATPQLMLVQSILHEIGHLTEYMDYEDKPDELKDRVKREKAAMPIGNATVGALLNPESQARKIVDTNWQQISEKLDVHSLDELITMQSVAYRNMTSEAHADMFAADVFAMNPQMDKLLQPVDAYRDYFWYEAA